MIILNPTRFKVEPHSKYWYLCIERWDLLSLHFSENAVLFHIEWMCRKTAGNLNQPPYRYIAVTRWAWPPSSMEMLLIPNTLYWSSRMCNCVCALPAKVQLRLRVTRRSWQKLFVGKNFVKILVTAQTQLHSYSEQQRAFENSNICNWGMLDVCSFMVKSLFLNVLFEKVFFVCFNLIYFLFYFILFYFILFYFILFLFTHTWAWW